MKKYGQINDTSNEGAYLVERIFKFYAGDQKCHFFINCQCIFHFLMIKKLRSLYIVDEENHVRKLSMLWMVLFACWVYCQGQKTMQCKSCRYHVLQTLTNLQGQSRQTGFLELALRDRHMQVRFFRKVFLESWDLRNFASATSFHEMHHVHHLQPNLQTYKKYFWKKRFWM